MKKAIIMLLAILLITGCAEKENNIFKSYKVVEGISVNDTVKEPISLTYSEYQNKIQNKDSFVLLLWQTGCGHCETFEPILNRVIDYYDLEIYSLNIATLTDEEYSKLQNKTFVTGTPTTVVFKDGVTQSKKLIGSKDEQTVIDFLVRYGYLEEA